MPDPIQLQTNEATAQLSLTAGNQYVWRVGYYDGSNVTYTDWSSEFTAVSPVDQTTSDDTSPPSLAYQTPRDLTLVQTLDGTQHYSWSAPDEYVGGYTLQIAEVGVTQDISSSGQFAVQADGSVDLTIQMDATSAGRVFVFASPTGLDEDYVPVPYVVAELQDSQVLVDGLYLPSDFTSAGIHTLLAAVLDVGEQEIGTVQSQPIAFGAHGSPRPPTFDSVDAMGLEITANVESTQTPHMLGFYPLDQITYYLEINQQADATSGWIRGAGVAATDPVVPVSATATGAGEWHARVVAQNPQGFGPPSEPVQVSGDL